MSTVTTTRIPPHQLDRALAFLKDGGRLVIRTVYRATIIEHRHIEAWKKAGFSLLKEEGDGYRMRVSRKSTVYLLPGQLEAVNEDGLYFSP